jgi:enoyl reductase-like protein
MDVLNDLLSGSKSRSWCFVATPTDALLFGSPFSHCKNGTVDQAKRIMVAAECHTALIAVWIYGKGAGYNWGVN